MSFKSSKIVAVLVGQVAWLIVAFVLFGGMTSPSQTASWTAILAMFFLLPLTAILWSALTALGAVAARTSIKPLHLYPFAAISAPLSLGVLALCADAVLAQPLAAVITRAELASFSAAAAVPGLVAGLFMALFGAPAPIAPRTARKPALVTETAAKLGGVLSTWRPPSALAPLLLPNLRADSAQFLAAASLLTVAIAALFVLNFLRVLGGTLGSLSGALLMIGQAVFLWCVICLFANRLRALGQSPFWALAPAVLAAAFVFTGPSDAAEWQAPLSLLLVYAIAGAVLATFKGGAETTDARPRSFGMRPSQRS